MTLILNVIFYLYIAAFVVSIFMIIICNPDTLEGSWQKRLYVYIFEHDDYVMWKYVNTDGRDKDIKFEEAHKPLDGVIPAAYYFTLPIPDYKSLKLKSEAWKKLVEWWDEGNEPELRLILWESNEPEDAHATVHAESYCLASHFVGEESEELAETLRAKICEMQDYES